MIDYLQNQSMLLLTILVTSLCLTAAHHRSYEEDSSDIQEYRKECGNNYSMACLKADIVRLIAIFSHSPPIQLMPGISISSSGIQPSLIGLNQRTADDILSKTLTDFFRSITIHVSLYNDRATELFNGDNSYFTARLKKYKFLTVYTVFAIAFALLSALVGKAMTLSIVSLIISMIARNGGIGNSPPNNSPPQVYDIVRRPHIQFANTHSTEEIFEGGARTSSSSPYTNGYTKIYARSSTSHPYSAYLHQDKYKQNINLINSTQVKM